MLIIILFIKIAVKSGIPTEQNPDNKNAFYYQTKSPRTFHHLSHDKYPYRPII
jgi:hypothetical protein